MENVSIDPGESVRFALGEIICPGFDELCRQIGSDLEIEGQVVFLSDFGKLRGHFAIVQVKGIHVPLIVPVENLRLNDTSLSEPGRMPVDKDTLVG